MRRIRELIGQVADTDVPVLITGDSGVGKGVIARALHRASNRSRQPFVKVNCAALPDQLLESELFGYERGAFTGADRTRPGKFELADGGTILLDEIGEISAGTQAKLLQVLQDGCYYRLGGNREVRVDARVVASTNRDLDAEIAEGTFRKDLFYRLNVVRVEVPALRERREEIPQLVAHFVRRYEQEYGRQVGDLPTAALEALSRYDWPGNVRELENVVRRMVVLEDVAGVIAGLAAQGTSTATTGGVDLDRLIGPDGSLPPLKEVSRLAALEIEGELIRRALEQTGWNRRKAAHLLDISYKALLYKIRDCGITAA
jgi:two-component system response regulator AtoC